MSFEQLQVTVTVPEDRQGEFHELFGRWLEIPRELRAAFRAMVATFIEEGGRPPTTSETGWHNGRAWGPDDLADARRLYLGVSDMARAMLGFWAEHSGEWVSGEQTAEFAGVKGPKGVAGSLSSVGKAAAKLGRQLPFEHKDGPPGASGSYQVTPLVARLLLAARDGDNR